jgi:hypothetical protein
MSIGIYKFQAFPKIGSKVRLKSKWRTRNKAGAPKLNFA